MAWDPMSADGNFSYRPSSDYVFRTDDYMTEFNAPAAKQDSSGQYAGAAAGIATAALAGGPAGVAIAVGLAAYQVYAGAKQAETIRRQANVTKQLNEMNAQYAELDAYRAEQDGQSEVARYQSEIDRVVGDQRVALAAANVDVNYGTAAELQGEARLTGLLNQMELQNRAQMKAAGLKRQANNIRFSATQQLEQANANASAAQTAGVIGALQTGVSAYSRK